MTRPASGRPPPPAPGAPRRARPDAGRMLSLTAVWGACFVTIRWGLRDAPVLWFAALRAMVAGAALVAVAEGQQRPRPSDRRAWMLIVALAVPNVTVAFAAMFAGVAGLATGTAAVLANAQPLLVLLPAWWLYGEPVSARMALGLAVGFSGLVVVALPGGGGSGAWLSILSAVGISAGTLLARRLVGIDLVQAAGWHFLLGGALLVAMAASVEGWPRIDWTPRFVASLAFLALAGTAAAFLVWFVEAQRCAIGPLAAWTFLTPVFGIGFGLVLAGERPGGWTVAGLALVVASLAIVLGRSRAQAGAEPT
ncbi:MAG: DMT family transporter [Acidimicrobiia bacterium]